MYHATIRYVRITPRKLRLVADLIRNKPVSEAKKVLKFSAKRGASILMKLLNSAVANATQNPETDADSLYVKSIMVGDGVIMKRFRAAPQGRSVEIKKRTSHTTIVLDAKKKVAEKPKPKKEEKK
ncbi:MAG: 50S ribosomal protein L22 [Planctomycetota bacterium]